MLSIASFGAKHLDATVNDAPVVLAWEVAESGRCLYARDADAETEFVTGARSRYWDFKPFLDEQWRLSGARLQERQRGTSISTPCQRRLTYRSVPRTGWRPPLARPSTRRC